ncbi:hypothetical protein [Mesorhizobium sp. M1329]|uniref:hypothetical protein n=1 Tax=Mesorhizobium sp. M1329 TaxID=2957083 RepID=UPI0033380C47
MQRIRKTGPQGVIRPFSPTPDLNGSMAADEKIAEALEHIAIALSAIDHNLEVMTTKIDGLLQVQARRK